MLCMRPNEALYERTSLEEREIQRKMIDQNNEANPVIARERQELNKGRG